MAEQAYPANPHVLRWARRERSLKIPEAAGRLGLSAQELQAYENGATTPTTVFLERMAAAYDIQFAALLMPEPLPESDPGLTDFRIQGGAEPELGLEIGSAIATVNETLEFYEELREITPDLAPRPSVESAAIDDEPPAIAARVRELLGVSVERQLGWDSDAEAYRTWREAVERLGVLVYQMHLGPRSNKGMSVFDDRDLPVVVINSQEKWNTPKIFSLLHELGHLILRQAGVSDENRSNAVERWCNQFAAHLLMPRATFAKFIGFRLGDTPRDWTDRELRRIAANFNVSMYAAAIHLEELGIALPGYVDRKLDEWGRREPLPPSPGRATWAERKVNQWGCKHVSTVLTALDRSLIDRFEANELLETKPRHFPDLRQTVMERRAAYGW